MGLTIHEQEIGIDILRTDGKDPNDYAIISVTDTRYIHKFDAFVQSSPEVWQHYGNPDYAPNGDLIGKQYRVHRDGIHFRAKKPKRSMTEEQRRASRERMLKCLEGKKSKSSDSKELNSFDEIE